MRHDRKIDRAVLRDDLIEPDLRVIVGVPARGDVLRTAGRRDEDSVDAERLAVLRRFDRLVRGDRPGADNDRDLAVDLLHRDLEHAALLLTGQVEDLARLRIDAQAAAHADEAFVVEEVAQEAPVSLLIDLHLTIEGQQRGDVEMISDGCHEATFLHSSSTFTETLLPERGSWSRPRTRP